MSSREERGWTQKKLVNVECYDAFLNDLKTNLSMIKEVKFLEFDEFEKKADFDKFYTNLKKIFESKQPSLTVKQLRIKLENEKQFLEILPHFQSVETLYIHGYKKPDRIGMKNVVQLDIWKNVNVFSGSEELWVTSGLLGFTHSKEFAVNVLKVSMADINLLKELRILEPNALRSHFHLGKIVSPR